MANPQIGDIWNGYKITQELARGGMSTLYVAEQLSIGREVVVKVMSSSLLGDPTFMERFTREINTMTRLQHPHIVSIYDVGEEEGTPFLVMAYVPGGTLLDRLRIGPIALAFAARIVEDVTNALTHAHAHGVIHRDVKPANVLLDEQDNAILTDFGVAKVLAATDQITRDAIVGTPSYLAPELIKEGGEVSPAVDVYGLGLTLYHALTGSHPFKGMTTSQLMWSHLNEPPPLIEPDHPELPAGVDALIQKALAKEPAHRYNNVADLASDLERIVAGTQPEIAYAAPPPIFSVQASSGDDALEDAVARVIDRVVKILRPDGGSGTGVFLQDNLIVTCLHVVDGSPGLFIEFRAGEKTVADVIARQSGADLALLRLREAPASSIHEHSTTLRHKAEPQLGELLAAIGHPLGLDWAVSGGHYNGLRQPDDEALQRFGMGLKVPLVQVDVAINPGNSGGPLIDVDGRLIGIATSIINPALVNNIGFAIEADTVWQFVSDNKTAEGRLVAYDDGHHHPEGVAYAPATGRPIKPLDEVSLNIFEGDTTQCSNCKHEYLVIEPACPLCGKPNPQVVASGEPTVVHEKDPTPAESVQQVVCSNCATEFDGSLKHCPACGKPVR